MIIDDLIDYKTAKTLHEKLIILFGHGPGGRFNTKFHNSSLAAPIVFR